MAQAKKKTGHAPLSQIAYKKIKTQIVRLELKPGDPIDESSMAAALEIGRTPVRESLLRLAAEGLVRLRPGRGFTVRNITLKDLKDLFEALTILERSAVALAARRIEAEDLKQLDLLNRQVQAAWKRDGYLQMTVLNSRFHRIIYGASGNAIITSYLNSLQSQSQRLAYLCFSAPAPVNLATHAEESIRDHQKLIDCLRRRDESGAVTIITRHVKLFRRRVFDFTAPAEVSHQLIA